MQSLLRSLGSCAHPRWELSLCSWLQAHFLHRHQLHVVALCHPHPLVFRNISLTSLYFHPSRGAMISSSNNMSSIDCVCKVHNAWEISHENRRKTSWCFLHSNQLKLLRFVVDSFIKVPKSVYVITLKLFFVWLPFRGKNSGTFYLNDKYSIDVAVMHL